MTVVRVAGDSTSPIRLRLAQSPAAVKMRLGAVEAVRLRFQSGIPGAQGPPGPTGDEGEAGQDAPNFETVATASAEDLPAATNYLRVAGHTAAGDRGGALYKKVGSEPSHEGKLLTADGAWWEIAEDVITPEMLGGSVQDAVDVADALDLGRIVLLAPIVYNLPAALDMREGVQVVGVDGATLKRTLTAAGSVVDFATHTAHRATLENVIIDGGRTGNEILVDPLFLVHNNGANDIKVIRCTLQNSNGHGFYMYAGLRPLFDGNTVTNINLIGVAIQPASQTDTAGIIRGNYISDVGYHPIQLFRSNYNQIIENNVAGNQIIGCVVDISGTAVTWVSGPQFTAVRKGTYIIYNGGSEGVVSVVTSATQITLTASGGSHNDVPAAFGTGDLIGIVGSSNNRIAGNNLRLGAGGHVVITDTGVIPGNNNNVQGNISYGAGSSSYSVQPLDSTQTVYNSIIGNRSIDAGQVATAGAPLFNCGVINAEGKWTHVADNTIVDTIGSTVKYGIVSSGTVANQMILGDNAIVGGALTAAIHRAVFSITAGAGWGTTAAVSLIVQNGKTIKFRITAGGTGIASFPTVTLATTASPTGINGPLPMAVMHRVTTGAMYVVRVTGADYTATGLDVPSFTPTTAETHDFTVHF